MKLTYAMTIARSIMKAGRVTFGNPEQALAIQIHDCMAEYNSNFDRLGYFEAQRKLSGPDRLFCGLGYSEFFTDGSSTDAEYSKASHKQAILYEMLGVDWQKLHDALERLYGR